MAQISFSDLVNGVVLDASDLNSRYNALKNRINNGMEADNIADGAITSAKVTNNAITGDKIAMGSDAQGDILQYNGTDYARLALGTDDQFLRSDGTDVVWETVATGKVMQVVNTQDGAVATGTTTIPFDDTIPQNTEGDEYMTLAITPTSATNKLKIEVVALVSHSTASNYLIGALFQDSTADALAMTWSQAHSSAGTPQILVFTHYMTTGTTSATTFKFRAGCQLAGTTTFNGYLGSRYFGGVEASSITITEIEV